jgi:hypothetical protein
MDSLPIVLLKHQERYSNLVILLFFLIHLRGSDTPDTGLRLPPTTEPPGANFSFSAVFLNQPQQHKNSERWFLTPGRRPNTVKSHHKFDYTKSREPLEISWKNLKTNQSYR